MARQDDNFWATAMARFSASKSAWSERHEEYSEDARYVNVLGGQWDKDVRERRKQSGKPSLEFNELHTYVQQVVNRARQDRPQPKVSPGDDESTQPVADFLEARLRHIHYASQADVAYDCAVECAATGGFGFLRITTEYTDKHSRGGKVSLNQEPRIRRILDPKTQYPDAGSIEPDFSDAKHWFSREWVPREGFKEEYGRDPVPFEGADPDWANETQVCIAEYWHIETKKRRYVALIDGNQGFADEIGEFEDDDVINERDVEDREVLCDLIDGQGKLPKPGTTKWLGEWIPIIPVLGREVVVDGKRYFISIVRYARGPQKLKNGYKSGIANLLGRASTAPWIGPKGTFKDKRWEDSNGNWATLEYDIVPLPNGQVAPPPERNTFEAPIQALSMAARDVSDDIKRAVGYSDAVVQPSKASDLSGVAVQRRSQQVDLTNFHFEDNLVRSQWHCARVVLDLDLKLADTPRVMRGRKEDGSTFTAPVTMADEEGAVTPAPGAEGKEHLRLDIGRYDVTIATGPSYNTKREEEKDILMQVLQANPAAWTIYGDLIFKKMGYADLEERARLTLPPAIQQAMQAEQQGIPPQAQAQIVSLTQRVQMLQQGLQKAIAVLQSKQIEGETKLHVERLKTAGAVMVEDMKQRHDATKEMHGSAMEAIQVLTQLMHESELGATPGPGMGNNALPEPAQPQGKVAA